MTHSATCPKCRMVLHGSTRWITKMLAKPCQDHATITGHFWQ